MVPPHGIEHVSKVVHNDPHWNDKYEKYSVSYLLVSTGVHVQQRPNGLQIGRHSGVRIL